LRIFTAGLYSPKRAEPRGIKRHITLQEIEFPDRISENISSKEELGTKTPRVFIPKRAKPIFKIRFVRPKKARKE
jgi:hypothetical protein